MGELHGNERNEQNKSYGEQYANKSFVLRNHVILIIYFFFLRLRDQKSFYDFLHLPVFLCLGCLLTIFKLYKSTLKYKVIIIILYFKEMGENISIGPPSANFKLSIVFY